MPWGKEFYENISDDNLVDLLKAAFQLKFKVLSFTSEFEWKRRGLTKTELKTKLDEKN